MLVTWDDACYSAAGDESDMTDVEPYLVETCGWLFKKTRRSLYVGHERLPRTAAVRWRGVTRIPVGMVESCDTIAGPGN